MNSAIFRGKKNKSSDWIVGYVVYCEHNAYILPVGSKNMLEFEKIDPDSVGQYVLKKLFEGDIIEFNDDFSMCEPQKAMVRWSGPEELPAFDAMRFEAGKWVSVIEEYNVLSEPIEFKILGNKYDNPEMLELLSSSEVE